MQGASVVSHTLTDMDFLKDSWGTKTRGSALNPQCTTLLTYRLSRQRHRAGRDACTCATWVWVAVKYSAHVDRVRYRPYTMPVVKMPARFHWSGVAEASTRSLDRAIMAPSLNTASSTIRMVGKNLQAR